MLLKENDMGDKEIFEKIKEFEEEVKQSFIKGKTADEIFDEIKEHAKYLDHFLTDNPYLLVDKD